MKKIKLSTKIIQYEIPILCWCIGLFLFPFILRDRLLGSAGLVNIFAYIGLFYGYSHNILRNLCFSKDLFFSYFFGILYCMSAISLIFFIPGTGWSLIRESMLVFVYVLPAAFAYMKLRDEKTVVRYCSMWLKWLRVVCTLMCIAKVADMMLGNAIQKAIATFYKSSTLLGMIHGGRFVSFYGHPLETAYVGLTLLVWTTVMNSLQKEHNPCYVYDIIVSLLVIAITGSKSGIALALALIMLCNIGIKNIKYFVLILIAFVALYFSGAFDMVLDRILEGLKNGDLSTGRNTAIERLVSEGTISFEWFRGHPMEYHNVAMIAALEYPFLRWAYVSGILFSVIMYLAYFIVPGIKLIRNFHLTTFVCALVFMAYVNGNNGISAYNDDLLFYAINIGLLLQLLTTTPKKSVIKWKLKR